MKKRLCAVAVLMVPVPLLCQPSMPAWLVAYPGAAVETNASSALVEAAYTTSATPDAVSEHYRKLFEAANLPFEPNPDGIGTTVRGAAAECDLLIAIHGQKDGTFVSVSCAAKSLPSASSARLPIVMTSTVSRPSTSNSRRVPPAGQSQPQSQAAAQAQHQQRAAGSGIHKMYRDAPAPPLVWPDWLVHMNGSSLAVEESTAPGNDGYLTGKYVTNAPMTAISEFYTELLETHGYVMHTAPMGTGQTHSGIKQNAHVEGYNYPDGAPGPRSEIRANFSRLRANGPIAVQLQFAVYAYKAPKWQAF